MTDPAAVLSSATTSELMDIFTTLEAPSVAAMEGEFRATLLRQPSITAVVGGYVAVHNPAIPWLSKAFRPIDAVSGRGYNTFTQFGSVVQRYPMLTQIAPSRYDGKPTFCLIYRAYHSLCATIHMVDEVRQYAPDVYLGIGTCGFTTKARELPRPFMLEGRPGSYRGDIGKPRAGFSPGRRELPGAFSAR